MLAAAPGNGNGNGNSAQTQQLSKETFLVQQVFFVSSILIHIVILNELKQTPQNIGLLNVGMY